MGMKLNGVHGSVMDKWLIFGFDFCSVVD